MCLIPSHQFPRIAKESIIVLKLVRRSKYAEEIYFPSYVYTTDVMYELGKRRKAYSRLWISWIILRNVFSKGIESGFIHSTKYPGEKVFPCDSTKNVINTCWHWGKSYALLKCIIPKGSLYYENSSTGEYASREIIPIKDVTSEILCQRIVM